MNYDADARQRQRTLVKMLFYFVVCVTSAFAFAKVWRLFVGPYSSAWTRRSLEYGKAAVYVRQSTCTDASARALLENYNGCERATITLSQSPAALAFHDLMDELKFCDQGVCILFGFNVTDTLWSMARFGLFALVVIQLLSFIGFVSLRHGHASASHQLPMMIDPVAYAQFVAKQQEMSSPPPQCTTAPPR